MSHNLAQNADGSAHFVDRNGRSSLRIGYNLPTLGSTTGLSFQRNTGGSVTATTINLASVAVTLTDAGTAGSQGSVKLFTMPEGLITMLGASCSVAVTCTLGVTATGAVVASIGTAAASAADATLSSTEADIIPSTACTLTSSVGTFAGISTTSQLVQFDGTATAKDVYLNIAVADASSTGNATATLVGSVTIVWVFCGDK